MSLLCVKLCHCSPVAWVTVRAPALSHKGPRSLGQLPPPLTPAHSGLGAVPSAWNDLPPWMSHGPLLHPLSVPFPMRLALTFPFTIQLVSIFPTWRSPCFPPCSSVIPASSTPRYNTAWNPHVTALFMLSSCWHFRSSRPRALCLFYSLMKLHWTMPRTQEPLDHICRMNECFHLHLPSLVLNLTFWLSRFPFLRLILVLQILFI